MINLGAGCALIARSALAAMPPSWVAPTHPTGKPTEVRVTERLHYPYVEKRYEPPVRIQQAVPKPAQQYGTPEMAMISRISAMMQGDFAWWNKTWDPESRRISAEIDTAMNRTRTTWLEWWRAMFGAATVALVRRIETGPYVVLTYKLLGAVGGDSDDSLELPVVFRAVDDQWLATLELRDDPLVPASPWVSGKSTMEEVVR